MGAKLDFENSKNAASEYKQVLNGEWYLFDLGICARTVHMKMFLLVHICYAHCAYV